MSSTNPTNAASGVFRGLNEAPRGSPQHPAEVWEAHKDEIRRLYMDERRSLREIINMMSGNGFVAT